MIWVLTFLIGMIIGACIFFVGIGIGRGLAYAEVLGTQHDTDTMIDLGSDDDSLG